MVISVQHCRIKIKFSWLTELWFMTSWLKRVNRSLSLQKDILCTLAILFLLWIPHYLILELFICLSGWKFNTCLAGNRYSVVVFVIAMTLLNNYDCFRIFLPPQNEIPHSQEINHFLYFKLLGTTNPLSICMNMPVYTFKFF